MLAKRSITRLVFTSFMLISLFFTSLGITPAYAASIIVNTAVDELTTNGKCSLREAIINANNNNQSGSTDCASGIGIDPISFAANYTITLAGELPIVTSEIVINGKGAAKTIIQASTCNPVTLPGGCTPATYRVFEVYITGNLTLNGLTVRHGRCAGACTGNGDRGGGIHSVGGPLTVTNSTISGNSATDAGGGISSGSPLAVTNSTISGNSAPSGGGILSGDNDLTIMNSTISGNSAELGGGIFTAAGFAENNVFITNSIFSGNNAANSGGGIYNRNFLTVLDSTLSGNSATNGGGIYNDNGHHLEVRKSTLSGNAAAMGGGIYNSGILWIGNGTLSGNEAYDYGGGIYSDGSTWIYNSTIVFNTLIEGTNLGAGGIDGDAALYNSIVAGNTRAISSEYRDCSGTIHVEGMNLFWDMTNCSVNPASPGFYGYLYSLNELGPLKNNGGPTWTHALLSINGESRAINAGDNALCASGPVYNLDQRGVKRPQGSRCDVGAYEAPSRTAFRSGGAQDGWVLESGENSNQGGVINAAATTFFLGDNAGNRQYRAILHFNTSSLPDNAVITRAVLRIKRQSIVGTNPFTTHGKIAVDIRKGAFSNSGPLQATDFQAPANKPGVGLIANNLYAGGWYSSNLKAVAYPYINRTGITQLRLRFQLDDDNDLVADYIRFYSGNVLATNRPALVIEYYVP